MTEALVFIGLGVFALCVLVLVWLIDHAANPDG